MGLGFRRLGMGRVGLEGLRSRICMVSGVGFRGLRCEV